MLLQSNRKKTAKIRTVCHFLFMLFGAMSILLSPCRLGAQQAFANSNIKFFNFQITPSQGTLELQGPPWTAEALAQAQNSLGEFDQASDVSFGGTAQASAQVTYARGDALLNAANLTGQASSLVNIPDCDMIQARSVGRGDLINTFQVTGGTGAVSVTFAADIQGMLKVFTGPCGVLAETDTTFSLEVFGVDATGNFIANPVLFRFNRLEVDGPDQSAQGSFSDHLSATLPLVFSNQTVSNNYDVFLFIDSESQGITTVPEPSMLACMSIGIIGLGIFFRQRRHPKSNIS